jgi:SH3 domain-containing YSC84-like protein 1
LSAAVRAFSQQGSLTLGGNISSAAGPIGTDAEAAGAGSLKSVASVFSYSKTKGLFSGVSLKGSAIVEWRDANEKLYGQRYTASQLMEGSVRPPPAAASLMNVFNSRVFNGIGGGDDSMYNDVPLYDDRYGKEIGSNKVDSCNGGNDNYTYSDRPKRASTWAVDPYTSGFDDSPTSSKSGPGRPVAPKPAFGASKTGSLKENQVIALFTFDPDQPGDLGFKKGDIITLIKKTDKAEDWW